MKTSSNDCVFVQVFLKKLFNILKKHGFFEKTYFALVFPMQMQHHIFSGHEFHM